MDGSCSAASRRSWFASDCDGDSNGNGSSSYATAAFVTAVVLTAVLLPSIWRLAGSTLGWYLRQRTEGQRQSLLEMMAADEKRFQKQQQQQQKKKNGGNTDAAVHSSDDDWENVEADAAASAVNGAKGASDWDGIVGFFHPFWCVQPLPVSFFLRFDFLSRPWLTGRQQCRRRRRARAVGGHPRDTAALAQGQVRRLHGRPRRAQGRHLGARESELLLGHLSDKLTRRGASC